MATGAADPKTKGVNRIGLRLQDYRGAESTLCAGCGHDAITNQIIKSFHQYGVESHRVVKLSGIGCSSKTPAYFLSQSHGFNAVHGRMPAVGTGEVMIYPALYLFTGYTSQRFQMEVFIQQQVYVQKMVVI